MNDKILNMTKLQIKQITSQFNTSIEHWPNSLNLITFPIFQLHLLLYYNLLEEVDFVTD